MRGKANPARCPQCSRRDSSVLYRRGEWWVCNWCYWIEHPDEMPAWALKEARSTEVLAVTGYRPWEGVASRQGADVTPERLAEIRALLHAEEPSAQAEMQGLYGDPPWTKEQARPVEERHGHSVLLKCYPEFGCRLIEEERDQFQGVGLELLAEVERLTDMVESLNAQWIEAGESA